MNKVCFLYLLFIYSITCLYASNESGATTEEVDIDGVGDEDLDEDIDEEADEESDSQNVDDPYEKLNRKIFAFNEGLDEIMNKISKPGSKPGIVRQGLSNFAQNFFEIPRTISITLQGDGKGASKTICRYVINTFMGFFGFIDVASKLGLEKQRPVFNDALKKWGVPPGDFVVLPFLGPTSMRGAVSQMVHMSLDRTALAPINNWNNIPKRSIYWITWLFDALNTRSAYGDFLNNITAMSKDKYKTVRNLVMAMEK